MSAKPCKGCGKLVVFAKDPEGKWQVLDNTAPTWKQIGVKDGIARVIRAEGVMVSHWSTCPEAYKKVGERTWEKPPEDRHFNEPKEADQ